jgi:hypothetical protein
LGGRGLGGRVGVMIVVRIVMAREMVVVVMAMN